MHEELKKLLEEILGHGTETSRGNYKFYCPICHHKKQKLEVNLDSNSKSFQKFQCWTCPNTKGNKIFFLLKILNVSKSYYDRLNKILKTTYTPSQKIVEKELTLPKEYTPLYIKQETPEYKAALHYLKRRNIGIYDILKYSIGYCQEGNYQDYIIFPTFDKLGKLNYYSARTFYDGEKMKYRNPNYSKDIITNELFINWNFEINLVEGIFDAIAVRRNSIALLGKIIQPNLLNTIFDKNPPKVNIILDEDALDNAYNIAEKLISGGITTKVVKLPKYEDPSSLGFERVWELIRTSEDLKFGEILKHKIFKI